VGPKTNIDRAVAKALCCRLPTPAARVRSQVIYLICGGQSDTGAGFLRVLLYP
jgi:hypothetical protein